MFTLPLPRCEAGSVRCDSMSKRLLTLLLSSLLVVAIVHLPAVADAQVDRATLTGVVRDPGQPDGARGHRHGDAYRNRSVAEHRDRPQRAAYLLVNLAPGSYQVDRSVPRSSRPLERTVVLEVGQRGRLDFALARRGGRRGRDGRRRRLPSLTHKVRSSATSSAAGRSAACRSRLAIGTTCSLPCPASRATATPSRQEPRTPDEPAA